MESWRLPEIPTPEGTRSPVVLKSEVEGTARIASADGQIEAPAGTLAHSDPDERHSVASDKGAKLLLLLAPWPGPGHFRGSG